MNGAMLLRHAAAVVEKRRDEYGEPEDLFEHVAARWSQVLGRSGWRRFGIGPQRFP